MAKNKKLSKVIAENIVTITEAETGIAMAFDFKALPQAIQDKLGPFGLGHKLGDAAAGKAGEVATKSIQAVWDGLAKGDWSTRAPAVPKFTKAMLSEKLGTLSEKEQKMAKDLLAKFGIIA